MAIALEIKSIDSADVPLEIQTDGLNPFPGWSPSDPEDFGMQLTVLIGVMGFNAGDNFQIYVCTRKHHKSLRPDAKQRLRLAKYVYIERYSWPALKTLLEDRVRGCQGADWPESLLKLRSQFDWEYENINQTSPRDVN